MLNNIHGGRVLGSAMSTSRVSRAIFFNIDSWLLIWEYDMRMNNLTAQLCRTFKTKWYYPPRYIEPLTGHEDNFEVDWTPKDIKAIDEPPKDQPVPDLACYRFNPERHYPEFLE